MRVCVFEAQGCGRVMSENVITKQLGVETGDLQWEIGADKEQLYEGERERKQTVVKEQICGNSFSS